MVLLAGCSAPDESDRTTDASGGAPRAGERPVNGGDPSCGQRFAGPPGDNAALLPSLKDEPDVVVERLLAVVGDETIGAPRVEREAIVWETRLGEAAFVRFDEHRAAVNWAPRDPYAEDPAALLARALEAFSVPPEVQREGAEAWNVFEGARVGGTAAAATLQRVFVGPLYEWAPDATALPDDALLAKAQEVAACLGVQGEARKGSLDVVGPSLAWTIDVAEGCTVRLDAQTGSFIGGTPCVARDA